MRIDVVSIFPDYLSALGLSLPGKAQESGLLDLRVHDLRGWTTDRHRTVDDTPYGGGAGMVMRPEPWGAALDEVTAGSEAPVLVVPTPSGEPFSQRLAHELAGREHLVFACGRYEGIDQRVMDHARTRMEVREVSLGDYVLNGGEVAALAVIEAVVRLLPGFMGNPDSLAEESHTDGGLLEYPVYTKPASWRGLDVPPVLLSGDHAKIAAWRHDQALRRTAQRRPDLAHPSRVVTGADLRAAGEDGSPVEGAVLSLATPADLGELMTLQWACFPPALHEPLEVLAADVLTATSFVLRVGGRLVGAVSARLDRAEAGEPGGVWHVFLHMVAPDLRGRGLGRFLLETAEGAAPDEAEGFRIWVRDDEPALLRFHKRAGYSDRGPRPDVPGVREMTKRRRR